jgi:Xaa-Pro dipeptidase
MEKKGIDALVVYGESLAWERMGDVRWLSGFAGIHGHTALLLPIDGAPSLVMDGNFHGEPMHSYAWMTWIEDIRPVAGGYGLSKFAEELRVAIDRSGSTRLGFVGDELLLRSLLKGISCVNASDIYLEAKAIKSELELKAVRAAGRATTAGFEAAIQATEIGRTEKEVIGKATEAMYSTGADSVGLMVISGPRAGLKHSDPGDRRIERGDMAYFRGGATVRGYTCETSRSMVVGRATQHQRELLDDVHEVYSTIVSMMRVGARTRTLYEKATSFARERGYPRKAGKHSFVDFSVSHGIGTSFLELPTIYHVAEDDTSVLESGMCMAYEPMTIVLGLGTAVVEDTLVIRDGRAEAVCNCETRLW